RRRSPPCRESTLPRYSTFSSFARVRLAARGLTAACWACLPEVVRLAARVVDLAEHVFDRQPERDVGGARVGQLYLQAAAIDLGHHHDRRRLRRREEVVEGVGEQPSVPVGEAVALPRVLGVAADADARLRKMDLLADGAARADQRDVGVALAE